MPGGSGRASRRCGRSGEGSAGWNPGHAARAPGGLPPGDHSSSSLGTPVTARAMVLLGSDPESTGSGHGAAGHRWQPGSAQPRPCRLRCLAHLILSLRVLLNQVFQEVDFTNAKLLDCRLSQATLEGANLSWANLSGCRIVDANLNDSELFHTTFDGGTLDRSTFQRANMFGANLNEVQARNGDFYHAYMKDIAMEESDLSGSNFELCFMQRAVLIESDLVSANLAVTVLTGAALEGADLTGSNLSQSLLNGAHLEGAKFNGAKLNNARFVNAYIDGTTFTDATWIPEHLQIMLDKEIEEDDFFVQLNSPAWNGQTVPKGEQCQKFGGIRPKTPELSVIGIPEGTNMLIMEFSDRSFKRMDDGGHGKIGYTLNRQQKKVNIPPVAGHSFTLPPGYFMVAAHRSPKWDRAGAYMPPCSGGKGNAYYVTVKAVKQGGQSSTILAQQEVEMGRY